MAAQETPRYSIKLEVIVSNGEMQLRIDGSPISPTTRFIIDDSTLIDIKREYMSLDSASLAGSVKECLLLEAKLGRRLAEILLGTAGPLPEHSLARILHCYLRDDESSNANSYVRLILSFDDPTYAGIPWELALWDQPWTGEEIYLGHDPRIALTRSECNCSPSTMSGSLFGGDGVLSILYVGADDSDDGKAHHEFTSRFFRSIDEYIPRLHTTCRWYPELETYYQQSERLTGQRPQFDIVHWRGHGSARALTVPTKTPTKVPPGDQIYEDISAKQVRDLTGNAFLYVMLTCESGGGPVVVSAKKLEPLDELRARFGFSTDLLTGGAPAVLGIYYNVGLTEFDHLPVLYPLLFRGLPLDHSVQYLRRFFARRNAGGTQAPYAGWYKLMLHTSTDRYLDGMPPVIPTSHPGGAISDGDLSESFLTLLER